MSWIKYWSLALVLMTMVSCKEEKMPPPDQAIGKKPTKANPLMEAGELIEKLKDGQKFVIVDFRPEEDYIKGHLPNAVHIWRPDIEDDAYPYKGMMANKTTLEALFSRLGVDVEDTLVVYDNHGSYDAARLWWVLKVHSFEGIKILNGGIKEWEMAGGSLTREINQPLPSRFQLPQSDGQVSYLIDLETFSKEQESDSNPFIIDTRTPDEYSGKRQKKGAMRAGHIPNSTHIDWAKAVEYNGTGKFRSLKELEAIYGKMGIAKDHPIVTYCHTGVRSAHTTFVLTQLLGYTNVRNYDGSWSEWSYYENLPIEKDSLTVILQ